MIRMTRLAAVVALSAVTLGLAACGDKDKKETATSTPTEAPKTATPAATPAAAQPATIAASDFAFAVAGQVVPGIQTITFKNGGKEDHELQLVSLDQGKTLADVQKLLSTPGTPIPDWVKFNGGAWAIPAGAQSTMTAKLDAKSYILLCFVESADGKPHFAKGMVGALDVKGTEAKDAAPTATLSIEATDYAFKAPAEASAGKATISLKNSGKEAHFAGLIRVPDGVPFETFMKGLLTPPATATATASPKASPAATGTATAAATAAAPAASGYSGGVGALSSGGQAWSTTELKAGTYAIVCFVPDAKGVPHAALGMASKLTVK